MADVSGATAYTCDARNRLTQKQTPFGTLNYTYDWASNLLTLASSGRGTTSGLTTYNYDAVGNLQNFVYPNGVTHAYTYDPLNRLTQMGSSNNSAPISNYAYTLGLAGNRLTVAELSGRSVAYGYDSLYRLTSETVSADPNNKNGAINYTYDAVGNRKTLNATLPPAGGISYTYDADDRLGSDQYDNNGNTILSGGTSGVYDFENHLTQKGGVTSVYDGDGNRVSETVAGVTMNYLVEMVNPTGYAQVAEELQNGTVTRTYSYGLERISENQTISSTWTPSFYGYDGHGSVRQLSNAAGVVTDTYDYDAFGNLVNSTGSTPNNYLFAGEQYDPALSLYYNRARYLNTTTDRFWSMDDYDGEAFDPMSFHKYLYAGGNPVGFVDPTGHFDDIEAPTALSEENALGAQEDAAAMRVYNTAFRTTLYAGNELIYSTPTILAKGIALLTALTVATTAALSVAEGLQPGDQLPDVAAGQKDDETLITLFRDTSGTSPSDFKWRGPIIEPDGLSFFEKPFQTLKTPFGSHSLWGSWQNTLAHIKTELSAVSLSQSSTELE